MNQPRLGKIVKFVNIVIALALVAVLGAVYWFAWRPLPQRSGTIPSEVAAAVTVTFDKLGEPHIRAGSLDNALFAQGYVTAQDRLFQMDALRRFSSGELAEVFGPSLVESDKDSRRLRLRRTAEQGYLQLPAEDRAAFGAYTRGVNAYISSHLENLPIEFTLLGYQPRPWSAIDSLLICLHMFRDLTTTYRNELIKSDMLAGGDTAKVNYLFPPRAGSEVQPGSNAWVLAGSHTASGKPILSNDMHLEYSLPGIWYMAHIQAPGLNVAGVSIPGAPGITVGHNDRIAWGITNLQFDVQDLYIEKLDDRSGRYVFRNQIEQAQTERELIRVKGQKPVELVTYVTRHGPVLIAEGNTRLALRWTAYEPGVVQYPVLDIDRAQNWQQFTTALHRWGGPGSNFVYADADGNIGYQAAGKLPRRNGFNGDVPVDGASGNFEWDGMIPFEELPSAYNPPGGIIATSNQNPFPANSPYPVNGNFAPPDRSTQVRDRLSVRNGWRAEEMLGVQTDIYSAFAKFLAGQLVASYEKRQRHSPELDAAVALLKKWNGQMEKDLAAPFIFSLAYLQVRTAVAENASPGKASHYEGSMAPAIIRKLLTERPAGWFRDYDEMLLRAFIDAMDEGRRMQGRDPNRWLYGKYMRLTIDNPVIHKVPWIGKYFDIGPIPMSGSATTVKQTSFKLAPSMRMDADLGDWNRSLLNVQIGQSGQILSSHYRDQWNNYYSGKSYPMQFGNVDAKSTLEFRPGK
jgi:penicillin G amidase